MTVEETDRLKQIKSALFGKENKEIWQRIPKNITPSDFVFAVFDAYAPHSQIKEKIDSENLFRISLLKDTKILSSKIEALPRRTIYNPLLNKFLEERNILEDLKLFIKILEQSESSPNDLTKYSNNNYAYSTGEAFAYSSRESKSNPDITFIRVLSWNLGSIGFKKSIDFYEVIGLLTDFLYPIQAKENPTDKKKIENALNLHSRRKKVTSEG